MKTNPFKTIFRAIFALFVLAGNLIFQLGASAPVPYNFTEKDFKVPDSEMIWGAKTNFTRADPSGKLFPSAFRAGIRVANQMIVISGHPLKISAPASVYLRSVWGPPAWKCMVGTNMALFVFIAPTNKMFSATMRGADGGFVPKTPEGRAIDEMNLTKIFWRRTLRSGYKEMPLYPYQDYRIYSFDPTRYFAIKSPGLYQLTLVQSLYIINTNDYLKEIALPPVTVDVKVEF